MITEENIITFKKTVKLEIIRKTSIGTGRFLIPSAIIKGDNMFEKFINVKVLSKDDKVYFIPNNNVKKINFSLNDFDIIDEKIIDKYGKISICSNIVDKLNLSNAYYMLSVIDDMYMVLEKM